MVCWSSEVFQAPSTEVQQHTKTLCASLNSVPASLSIPGVRKMHPLHQSGASPVAWCRCQNVVLSKTEYTTTRWIAEPWLARQGAADPTLAHRRARREIARSSVFQISLSGPAREKRTTTRTRTLYHFVFLVCFPSMDTRSLFYQLR